MARSPPVRGNQTSPPSGAGDVSIPPQEKTPKNMEAPDNKILPLEDSSAMAPLVANVELELAPAIQLDFNTNQNLDSSLNSNVTPNPILDKSLDQALGAQALSPGSPSVNTAPLNNPLQASLDPSLFDLNDEPSSPTQALRLL